MDNSIYFDDDDDIDGLVNNNIHLLGNLSLIKY